MNELILSIFPGIDLLGRGFEEQGFCVVQAQDKITGGDVRRFHPPKGRFNGLIGGSPCQDFSLLNRNPTNNSHEMQGEYCRVVVESDVDWFLYENVVTAPSFEIDGYTQQRFTLDLAWFSDYSRRRDFIFGSKNGALLEPMTKIKGEVKGTAVLGSDDRTFEECCSIQGVPSDVDLSSFNLSGKKQAVANGVPLVMAKYIAGLIKTDYYAQKANPIERINMPRCACGCGRPLAGRAKTASASCRKRFSRNKAA
jgi:DNA (cytosine-5)-methyltransferase 1